MKNVLKELWGMYYEMLLSLDNTQKAIFILWSFCVVLFVFSYIRGVIALTQYYINLRKSKPQKF